MQQEAILTRTIPLGWRGSSHCATTVLELTALARTLIGALLGADQQNTNNHLVSFMSTTY